MNNLEQQLDEIILSLVVGDAELTEQQKNIIYSKTMGLEEAKTKLIDLVRRERVHGHIEQIIMMDGIATDNLEMWLKNCLASYKKDLTTLNSQLDKKS